jgi:sulfatase modifying factor 1
MGMIAAAMFFSGIAHADVAPQKYRAMKLTGAAEFKKSKTDAWQAMTISSSLANGYSIKTGENTEISLSFEPAINIVVSSNTMLDFDNLQIDREQKTIRMLMRMQNGHVGVTMPSGLRYKMLFTLETPFASIYLTNADVEVYADNHSVKVEVLRQSAKVHHTIAGLKTIVYANSRAVIDPRQPVIQILQIAPIAAKESEARPSTLKVAILSMQSEMDSSMNLESVSDFVAHEIEKQSRTNVLFLEDVRTILKAEGVPGLLDCYTDSCISRIATFLGVDLVVIGKLGHLGERYLFNLKMIDALRGKTVTRVNTTAESKVGNIIDQIPGMVNTLVTKNMEAEAEAEPQSAKDSLGIPVQADSIREMVWIYPDTYTMGSELNTGDFDESPQHTVTVHGFYIDRGEVSKDDFQRVMGYNPSLFKGCGTCPVDNVSWEEARDYCAKVSKRLPSEAEWEFACRAGTKTPFHYGGSISSENANFDGRKPFGGAAAGVDHQKPLPCGSFKANGWGLFDMHGNVAEWCADWYDPAYYGNSPQEDPRGAEQGKFKVVRGGGWNSDGAGVRCANRNAINPTVRLNSIGFRCVREYTQPVIDTATH